MDTRSCCLLPVPQQLSFRQDSFTFGEEGLILLDAPVSGDLLPAGTLMEAVLWKCLHKHWDLNAVGGIPAELQKFVLRLAPGLAPNPQGYRIHITPQAVVVEGHDPAGVYYGVCTLRQLIQQFGKELPCLEISDWPDIPARGVMLDISRDKVYRMETLYELIDRLAGLKINQLQLYTEHSFAYRKHPEAWKDASPITGEEIFALDKYCKERFIELVPNQNSFGHLHHWLRIDRYAHLAEITGEFQTPWGIMEGPFSLSPAEAGSLPFIAGLYDELLPHFSSKMVNIGCDETVDLGSGKSKALCDAKGTGRVYLDFLLSLYEDVKRRGYTPQFWGDIIIQHPELVSELPRDMIALEWGYEATHPFMEHGKVFAASGIPYYVCPGTSAWNTLVGRTDNALKNLSVAAQSGKQYGAIGYLITDWGDSGHWQTYPVSFLGFAAGAAFAWALEANRGIDIRPAVSRFAFEDASGSMGVLAYELGNIYHLAGYEPDNQSAVFQMLQRPITTLKTMPELHMEAILGIMDATGKALDHLGNEEMTREDASLIREEFRLGARMVQHGCKRGLFALGAPQAPSKGELKSDLQEILVTYRSIWLQRNRPGGLDDSTRRLEILLKEYE